ncbi:MAG: LuxR C-terminal-related transcriptional regulator [Bacteroidota bacterium]
MLEYITPLLFSDQGNLLLSLHIFSNINHLKKNDSNSILALHKPNQHQYFSISDYRMDEIFFGQREQEIMMHTDKNLLSKEIAKQINLSVHTVDTHLRNLRDRLGVAGTNALISYCKEITNLFGN